MVCLDLIFCRFVFLADNLHMVDLRNSFFADLSQFTSNEAVCVITTLTVF